MKKWLLVQLKSKTKQSWTIWNTLNQQTNQRKKIFVTRFDACQSPARNPLKREFQHSTGVLEVGLTCYEGSVTTISEDKINVILLAKMKLTLATRLACPFLHFYVRSNCPKMKWHITYHDESWSDWVLAGTKRTGTTESERRFELEVVSHWEKVLEFSEFFVKKKYSCVMEVTENAKLTKNIGSE